MAKKRETGSYRTSSIFLSFQKAYRRFLKIRGTPRQIALGFALGLFVGMSPTMGVQMPIAVFFAALLKWNKISAVVGVWISNPVTAPILYGLTFFIGSKITGVTNSFSPNNVFDFDLIYQILIKAPEIFLALVLGGVVAGIPLAMLGYQFSFTAVNRYQEGIKQKLARQKERLAVRKEQRKLRKTEKRRNLSEGKMLTVYSAGWCYHCRKTIDYLEKHKIDFVVVDIETASQAVLEQVVQVNGGDDWVVPTLHFKGQWRPGKVFDRNGLSADLEKMGVTPRA